MRRLRKAPSLRIVAVLLATVYCLVGAPRPARAQWLTTDIPHIGVQLAEFAKKASDWVKTVQNYQVVRDAYTVATTAKDITSRIRDINDQVRGLTQDGLNFQHAIQDALKRVQAISQLRISSVNDVLNIASNISSFSLHSLMPNLGQSQRLMAALSSGRDQDAAIVRDELNTFSTTSGVRRNVLQSGQQKAQAAVTAVALETNAQEEKVAAAFRYKKTADELTAQAAELQAGTSTDGKFSMTDGERVLVQAQAADLMVRSQDLRNKAEQLLAEAAQKGPAQKAAESVVREQQVVAGLQGMMKEQIPGY